MYYGFGTRYCRDPKYKHSFDITVNIKNFLALRDILMCTAWCVSRPHEHELTAISCDYPAAREPQSRFGANVLGIRVKLAKLELTWPNLLEIRVKVAKLLGIRVNLAKSLGIGVQLAKLLGIRVNLANLLAISVKLAKLLGIRVNLAKLLGVAVRLANYLELELIWPSYLELEVS